MMTVFFLLSFRDSRIRVHVEYCRFASLDVLWECCKPPCAPLRRRCHPPPFWLLPLRRRCHPTTKKTAPKSLEDCSRLSPLPPQPHHFSLPVSLHDASVRVWFRCCLEPNRTAKCYCISPNLRPSSILIHSNQTLLMHIRRT